MKKYDHRPLFLPPLRGLLKSPSPYHLLLLLGEIGAELDGTDVVARDGWAGGGEERGGASRS